MIAALFLALKAAEKRHLGWAIASGIVAGLATAMKYNGLWAGAALPAALFAAMGFRCLKWPGFWLGGLSVPVGFILGNPGAVFDFRRFWEDFYYNLQTTPVYEGQTTGHGYYKFLANWPDLVGWPGSILLVVGLLVTLFVVVTRRLTPGQKLLLLAALAVFLPYYLSIGRFPRMGPRFVLPAMPFVILIAAVGFAHLPWKTRVVPAVLGLVLLYNIAASVESGLRFMSDPRMAAWAWVRENVPADSLIENSYAPHWRRMPSYRPTIVRLPAVTGRSALFAEMFKDDAAVQEAIARHETDNEAIKMFTREALEERNPDFITFSSQVFEWSGDDLVQRFYGLLDAEQLGYRKVFDRSWRPYASWSYPRGIDFLVQRMVILEREPEPEP